MHCLVTGGAGFIGSHLCTALHAAGHQVIAVDNLVAGSRDNLVQLLAAPRFTFLPLDVRDLHAGYLRGVEVVFHLAASKKNVCDRDPHEDMSVNAGGTLNVLRCALQAGVRRVVHISTGSVYGNVCPQLESGPTLPVSHYGVSKLAGEHYARLYGATTNLETTILRLFHVYGPRQVDRDGLGGVIAVWLRRLYTNQPLPIHGNGAQERCFTYVGDVVTACQRAVTAPTGVYNVVSNVRLSLNVLTEQLFEITDRRVPLDYTAALPGDIRYFEPSNVGAIKALGLRFTALEQGLRITAAHYAKVYEQGGLT